MSFSVMINSYISALLTSVKNFYLVEKQNKENFAKKIVDSGIVKTCDEVDRLW